MKQVTTKASTLCGLLVLAALLRAWTLNYDLPYIYHPDEPVNVDITQRIFKSGDLNPHFFGYPSFFYYINDLVYGFYYFTEHLVGTLQTRNDIAPLTKLAMGVTKAPQPGLILLGRAVTAAFGLCTVAVTFLLGIRLLKDSRPAILGALIAAVAPTNVELSRFITPDTFVTFFAAASVLAATYVEQEARPVHYVLGGMLVGLTASTKYNGALVILPLIAAHFLGLSRGPRRHWLLGLALLSCAVGFFAGSPFTLLDPIAFIGYLRFEGNHYSTGHPGMEGNTLPWYLSYMWQTAGVLYVCAAFEIVRGIVSRAKAITLLSVFPITYFIFIASFEVRNDRTFLPMTPFLFLLAASSLVRAWDAATGIHSSLQRRVATVFICCVAIIAVAQPAMNTLRDAEHRAANDSRKTARIWIGENLQPGSRIAIEPYAPFVDPDRFSVQAFERVTAHNPEWYGLNGFRYVIASEGMYGRFFREPDRYPKQVSEYNTLFKQLVPLKIFTDGNYEIRIYQVSSHSNDPTS